MHRISLEEIDATIDTGVAFSIGTRDEQQDAFLLNSKPGSFLAAICDGMGGLCSGRQASAVAIDALRQMYQTESGIHNFADFFQFAVEKLDERVFALREINSRAAVGTTIVAAGLSGDQLYWLSVGDSRLYLIRNEEIVCVTRDHNYLLLLEQAYRSQKITEAVFNEEKKRGEALVSYIGMGGIELMDCNTKPFILLPDDVILLMSDGLYRCLPQDEIHRIVLEGKSAAEIAADLVSKSESNVQQRDNTTVIVIKMNGVSGK